jgi:putative holliday junction resolvase
VGRVLGVDLGTRRIGLALSDPGGVIASPLGVLERSGDVAADHGSIIAMAEEHGAERIVVGLPLALSGKVGPAAKAALDEIEELRGVAGDALPVEPFDERLTTVIAERDLIDAKMRRADRRQVIDKVAAAVMLQSWLEARR